MKLLFWLLLYVGLRCLVLCFVVCCMDFWIGVEILFGLVLVVVWFVWFVDGDVDVGGLIGCEFGEFYF